MMSPLIFVYWLKRERISKQFALRKIPAPVIPLIKLFRQQTSPLSCAHKAVVPICL